MRLRPIITGLALCFSLLCPELAKSSQDMRRELGELAKGIKSFLDGRNAESIAIGQFTGPANFPTSAGLGSGAD